MTEVRDRSPARRAPRAVLAWTAAVTLLIVAACSGDDADDADEAGNTDGGQTNAADRADDQASDGELASSPASPSPGCDGSTTEQADLVETTMEVRGVSRRFLLSAPVWAEGDEPPPLVLDFHGLSEGADIHAEMTQLGPLGVDEGFVAVFPHGTGEPVAWQVAPDIEANDDLAFVGALLDRVGEERCVDTSRVYATGLSNGAMMASTVACTMADQVAAIVPVAGILMPEPCEPGRAVPVLTIHGTADPILLFNGGIDTGALDAALGGGDTATTTTVAVDLDGAGYPDTVRQWASLNGCDEASAQDERVSDEVIRRTFDCPDDAPVEFLIVEGGGHSWPSSELSQSIEQIVGPTTFDIHASQEIWEFVQGFRLPEP